MTLSENIGVDRSDKGKYLRRHDQSVGLDRAQNSVLVQKEALLE